MTQEPASRGPQQGKSASSKRSARSNRNRPVLVTSIEDTSGITDQAAEDTISNETDTTDQAAVSTSIPTRLRRLPKFFSTVGKTEETQETKTEVDPAQARIARATGGRTKAPSGESKQSATKAPVARSTPTRSTPARPPGLFKMRYIWGMIFYLISADLIGSVETSYLRANKLDSLLITLGPFPIYISTLLFLLTLLVILVILARLDLVPRSLGALSGQSTSTQRKSGSSQNASDAGSAKGSVPTMKQGVKGADDDLYEDYRAQQRYNQRRERKR